MSVQTIDKPVFNDVNNTNMTHITMLDEPYVAICGAKLQGIKPDTWTIDCVVCAEIVREQRLIVV